MNKDPSIFLHHILDSIRSIEEYTNSLSESEFLNAPEKQDSTVRRIEVIGEAVKNLSEDFKNVHTEIVWYKIAGMRDMLIHEYFGVDMELVWSTIQKDIPELKEQIEKIMKTIKP